MQALRPPGSSSAVVTADDSGMRVLRTRSSVASQQQKLKQSNQFSVTTKSGTSASASKPRQRRRTTMFTTTAQHQQEIELGNEKTTTSVSNLAVESYATPARRRLRSASKAANLQPSTPQLEASMNKDDANISDPTKSPDEDITTRTERNSLLEEDTMETNVKPQDPTEPSTVEDFPSNENAKECFHIESKVLQFERNLTDNNVKIFEPMNPTNTPDRDTPLRTGLQTPRPGADATQTDSKTNELTNSKLSAQQYVRERLHLLSKAPQLEPHVIEAGVTAKESKDPADEPDGAVSSSNDQQASQLENDLSVTAKISESKDTADTHEDACSHIEPQASEIEIHVTETDVQRSNPMDMSNTADEDVSSPNEPQPPQIEISVSGTDVKICQPMDTSNTANEDVPPHERTASQIEITVTKTVVNEPTDTSSAALVGSNIESQVAEPGTDLTETGPMNAHDEVTDSYIEPHGSRREEDFTEPDVKPNELTEPTNVPDEDVDSHVEPQGTEAETDLTDAVPKLNQLTDTMHEPDEGIASHLEPQALEVGTNVVEIDVKSGEPADSKNLPVEDCPANVNESGTNADALVNEEHLSDPDTAQSMEKGPSQLEELTDINSGHMVVDSSGITGEDKIASKITQDTFSDPMNTGCSPDAMGLVNDEVTTNHPNTLQSVEKNVPQSEKGNLDGSHGGSLESKEETSDKEETSEAPENTNNCSKTANSRSDPVEYASVSAEKDTPQIETDVDQKVGDEITEKLRGDRPLTGREDSAVPKHAGDFHSNTVNIESSPNMDALPFAVKSTCQLNAVDNEANEDIPRSKNKDIEDAKDSNLSPPVSVNEAAGDDMEIDEDENEDENEDGNQQAAKQPVFIPFISAASKQGHSERNTVDGSLVMEESTGEKTKEIPNSNNSAVNIDADRGSTVEPSPSSEVPTPRRLFENDEDENGYFSESPLPSPRGSSSPTCSKATTQLDLKNAKEANKNPTLTAGSLVPEPSDKEGIVPSSEKFKLKSVNSVEELDDEISHSVRKAITDTPVEKDVVADAAAENVFVKPTESAEVDVATRQVENEIESCNRTTEVENIENEGDLDHEVAEEHEEEGDSEGDPEGAAEDDAGDDVEDGGDIEENVDVIEFQASEESEHMSGIESEGEISGVEEYENDAMELVDPADNSSEDARSNPRQISNQNVRDDAEEESKSSSGSVSNEHGPSADESDEDEQQVFEATDEDHDEDIYEEDGDALEADRNDDVEPSGQSGEIISLSSNESRGSEADDAEGMGAEEAQHDPEDEVDLDDDGFRIEQMTPEEDDNGDAEDNVDGNANEAIQLSQDEDDNDYEGRDDVEVSAHENATSGSENGNEISNVDEAIRDSSEADIADESINVDGGLNFTVEAEQEILQVPARKIHPVHEDSQSGIIALRGSNIGKIIGEVDTSRPAPSPEPSQLNDLIDGTIYKPVMVRKQRETVGSVLQETRTMLTNVQGDSSMVEDQTGEEKIVEPPLYSGRTLSQTSVPNEQVFAPPPSPMFGTGMFDPAVDGTKVIIFHANKGQVIQQSGNDQIPSQVGKHVVTCEGKSDTKGMMVQSSVDGIGGVLAPRPSLKRGRDDDSVAAMTSQVHGMARDERAPKRLRHEDIGTAVSGLGAVMAHKKGLPNAGDVLGGLRPIFGKDWNNLVGTENDVKTSRNRMLLDRLTKIERKESRPKNEVDFVETPVAQSVYARLWQRNIATEQTPQEGVFNVGAVRPKRSRMQQWYTNQQAIRKRLQKETLARAGQAALKFGSNYY